MIAMITCTQNKCFVTLITVIGWSAYHITQFGAFCLFCFSEYVYTSDITLHRFKASDGKKGVAAADVIVNLCNCSGHGECLFDLLADGYELKQTFRIVQCNCSIGWEG